MKKMDSYIELNNKCIEKYGKPLPAYLIVSFIADIAYRKYMIEVNAGRIKKSANVTKDTFEILVMKDFDNQIKKFLFPPGKSVQKVFEEIEKRMPMK